MPATTRGAATPGYNPYRAWPTAFDGLPTTFSIDLPAVWRPHANQLPLWRAFYRDWDRLDCVAAPADRSITLPARTGAAASIWSAVATGHPTLLEVDGLPDPETPDIDQPLLGVIEDLLLPLLEGGFTIHEHVYSDTGLPDSVAQINSETPTGDPLIVLLATRNAAVDDAMDLVERLTDKLGLPDGVIRASTVEHDEGALHVDCRRCGERMTFDRYEHHAGVLTRVLRAEPAIQASAGRSGPARTPGPRPDGRVRRDMHELPENRSNMMLTYIERHDAGTAA